MKHYIKIILVPVFIFALASSSSAQTEKPNNIFLEIFGNAGAYSINYDRIIWNNISARGGMMLLPSDSKLITSVPLIINYRFYIGEYYLETGLGATFFSSSLNFGKLGEKTAEGKIFTGVISYCLQTESGFMQGFPLHLFFTIKNSFHLEDLALVIVFDYKNLNLDQ